MIIILMIFKRRMKAALALAWWGVQLRGEFLANMIKIYDTNMIQIHDTNMTQICCKYSSNIIQIQFSIGPVLNLQEYHEPAWGRSGGEAEKGEKTLFSSCAVDLWHFLLFFVSQSEMSNPPKENTSWEK